MAWKTESQVWFRSSTISINLEAYKITKSLKHSISYIYFHCISHSSNSFKMLNIAMLNAKKVHSIFVVHSRNFLLWFFKENLTTFCTGIEGYLHLKNAKIRTFAKIRLSAECVTFIPNEMPNDYLTRTHIPQTTCHVPNNKCVWNKHWKFQIF